MTSGIKVLAISEDTQVCNLVHTLFSSQSHHAICVSSSQDAIQLLSRGFRAELVLLDTSGNQSIDGPIDQTLIQMVPNERLCLLLEKGDNRWQSIADERNVHTVMTKPLGVHELESLMTSRLAPSPDSISSVLPTSRSYHIEELDNNRFFLAASPNMMQLYRDIRVLAPVDMPVLILGESGVGKEIVAMLLHKYHSRSEARFLNVNCAALPNELLESELFGYEAGAFTGAMKSKPGKFELANKGTLLLDEIGEMSPQMQAKLLHVLQDGSFSRLGARYSTVVDVRILAATNIDIQTAITERRFREDLFYRLSALTLSIPPLRQRREEVPLLIEELCRRGVGGVQPIALADRIFNAAIEYHWPGNLRELRNFVIRTLILRDQEAAYAYLKNNTQVKSMPPAEDLKAENHCKRDPGKSDLKGVISEMKNQTEIRMLQDALSAAGWNRKRAAMHLNISYRSLLYKIQQHGLSA
jgi:two-component system, NtrC family, response regulator AtoC